MLALAYQHTYKNSRACFLDPPPTEASTDPRNNTCGLVPCHPLFPPRLPEPLRVQVPLENPPYLYKLVLVQNHTSPQHITSLVFSNSLPFSVWKDRRLGTGLSQSQPQTLSRVHGNFQHPSRSVQKTVLEYQSVCRIFTSGSTADMRSCTPGPHTLRPYLKDTPPPTPTLAGACVNVQLAQG